MPGGMLVVHNVAPPRQENAGSAIFTKCATAWRRSGQPLPPVEVLQALPCKSRLLDTLDVNSRVVAHDQSSSLAAALGRLEGRAWHSAQVDANVQLEVDV